MALLLAVAGLLLVGALIAAGIIVYQNIQHDKQVQVDIKKQELKLKCLNEYNSSLSDIEKIDTTSGYTIRGGVYVPSAESYGNQSLKIERQDSSKLTYDACLSDVDKIQ